MTNKGQLNDILFPLSICGERCIVGKTSKRPGVLNGLGVVNLYASTILTGPPTLEGVTRTRGDGRGCRRNAHLIGRLMTRSGGGRRTAISIPLNLKGEGIPHCRESCGALQGSVEGIARPRDSEVRNISLARSGSGSNCARSTRCIGVRPVLEGVTRARVDRVACIGGELCAIVGSCRVRIRGAALLVSNARGCTRFEREGNRCARPDGIER